MMKQVVISGVVVAVVLCGNSLTSAQPARGRAADKAAGAKPPAKKAAVDGFSGNEAEVELLSGNRPAILSGNRARFLSGNTAKIVSKVSVLSGINVHVTITIGQGGKEPGVTERPAGALFGTLDRDGDGRLSPEEFERLETGAKRASF